MAFPPPSDSSSGIAVLCDFDGTITLDKVPKLLYQRFASSGLKYSNAWNAEEITTMEELELTFATIRAGRAQMEQVLDRVRLDPAVSQFLDHIHLHDWTFAIVSDGLGWYIRYLLDRHGLEVSTIFANEIRFTPAGFQFEHPWHGPEDSRLGVNKRGIIYRFQEAGYQVVYLGDGRSDVGAVGAADHLFATGWLADYCQQRAESFIPFKNLSQVLTHWTDGWTPHTTREKPH